MEFLVELDGSVGEGGGQILRTALTLSLLTQRPFHIQKIRANRPNPGLAHQHLMAVKAALAISESTARRAELQSQDLYFQPGPVKAGSYVISVPTAGAMTLVLQTIFLPLCLQPQPSHLEFQGGTHVPWAPAFEYLSEVWVPTLKRLGIEMTLYMDKAGYYPKGGGRFIADIRGEAKLSSLDLEQRQALQSLETIAVLTDIPETVATREWKALAQAIAPLHRHIPLKKTLHTYSSPGPGNALFLIARFENSVAGFDALGEKRKPSEDVANEVARQFQEFMTTTSAIDVHLADQILLPLAIAPASSRYSVAKIEDHLTTNAQIIQEFLPVKIEIQGNKDGPGFVEISPVKP